MVHNGKTLQTALALLSLSVYTPRGDELIKWDLTVFQLQFPPQFLSHLISHSAYLELHHNNFGTRQRGR